MIGRGRSTTTRSTSSRLAASGSALRRRRSTAEVALAADYERGAAAWGAGAEAIYRTFARVLVSTAPVALAGLRVLDLGCGTGAVSRMLRAEGASPVAVDTSPAMLRSARFSLKGLRAAAADALVLPFGGSSFDAVMAGFVLNHLPEPHCALIEAARVTRPGGPVMATTFAAGQDDRVKDAVEAIALRRGWDAPCWYHQQRRWANLTDTPEGLLGQAERAGLEAPQVSAVELEAGRIDVGDLVRWRLGHAHMASLTVGLRGDDLRRIITEVEASMGTEPQLLRRRLLVLSSHVRAR